MSCISFFSIVPALLFSARRIVCGVTCTCLFWIFVNLFKLHFFKFTVRSCNVATTRRVGLMYLCCGIKDTAHNCQSMLKRGHSLQSLWTCVGVVNISIRRFRLSFKSRGHH